MDRPSTLSSTTLRLTVNGRAVETRSDTLAALVVEEGHGKNRVATAINGDFVPEARRAATELKSGDRIEILTARQGG